MDTLTIMFLPHVLFFSFTQPFCQNTFALWSHFALLSVIFSQGLLFPSVIPVSIRFSVMFLFLSSYHRTEKKPTCLSLSNVIVFDGALSLTDLLTYCRFASQFLDCDTSAPFSICDVNPLQNFLLCASSLISARPLVECSLIGS